MGRRTILTPDITKKLCDALKKGHYLVTACQLVGVSKKAVYDWISKGEESCAKPPYREFAHSLKKAMAEAEDMALKKIETAALSSWQAAAWLLERRHPDKWAQRPRNIESGAPVALPGGITVIFNVPRPGPAALPQPPAIDTEVVSDTDETPRNEKNLHK